MNISIFVQAHHENWSGGKSYCLSIIDGYPVIYHVLKKLRQSYPALDIIVVAPDDEKNRCFEPLAKAARANVYYGAKFDILERFLGAAKMYPCDAIMRVIGEHYFINLEYIDHLKNIFQDGKYDIVIPPLDSDPKFSAEFVLVDALINAVQIIHCLSEDERINARANPIPFIISQPHSFNSGIMKEVPIYSHREILQMRKVAKKIYLEAYETKKNTAWREGDVLRMHYEFAKKYLRADDLVLDVACGKGFGSILLSSYAHQVIGADLSAEFIFEAKKNIHIQNLSFEIQDACKMNFKNESFDSVVSMETIEHINDKKFLSEVYRVLRSNGLFIVSTPQNGSGSAPLIPYHLREYSLYKFKKLLSRYFCIQDFYSFHSNYVMRGEHKGTGMMAICKKIVNI